MPCPTVAERTGYPMDSMTHTPERAVSAPRGHAVLRHRVRLLHHDLRQHHRHLGAERGRPEEGLQVHLLAAGHQRGAGPQVRGPVRVRGTVHLMYGLEVRTLALEAARALAVAYLVGVLGLLAWAIAPAAVGWRATVVVSGSMEPAIHVGDVVLFDREDVATLKAGRV